MKRRALLDQLRRHEGVRLKPYKDTVGKLTIGVGRNLDDVGISEDEAEAMLDNDINRVFREVSSRVPAFGSLDHERQNVLLNMAFNLGTPGLLRFTKMLAAVEARKFGVAADEMLTSKWATQVGKRATELAAQMRGPGKETE